MRYRFLLLLILNFPSLFSQSWAPAGAIWHYKLWSGIASIDGVIEFKYAKDTVINNLNCKIIIGTFMGKHYPYNGLNFVVLPNYRKHITYENNNVLYFYNGASFDTVVNYNAAIGDKWLRIRRYPTDGCSSRRALTVTDTGRVIINNQSLKKIVTVYTSSYTNMGNATVNVVHTNTFVEKVYNSLYNALKTDYELFPFYCEHKGTEFGEYPKVGFLCYQDDNFPLYSRVSSGCEITSTEKLLHNDQPTFFVRPNPFNEKLNIDFTDGVSTLNNLQISITNVLGQTVLVQGVRNHDIREPGLQLDVSGLKKGIYFLKLFDKEKLIATQKIIKE